jgi:cytochrome oxidase Cu insertion factor (SCO1/SenC/PrrC family)
MSRTFSGFGSILVLSVTLVAAGIGRARALQTNDPAATIDVDALGPRVGDALPAFSLRDQHGEARSLTSLLGSNGAVIVFFRSADW